MSEDRTLGDFDACVTVNLFSDAFLKKCYTAEPPIDFPTLPVQVYAAKKAEKRQQIQQMQHIKTSSEKKDPATKNNQNSRKLPRNEKSSAINSKSPSSNDSSTQIQPLNHMIAEKKVQQLNENRTFSEKVTPKMGQLGTPPRKPPNCVYFMSPLHQFRDPSGNTNRYVSIVAVPVSLVGDPVCACAFLPFDIANENSKFECYVYNLEKHKIEFTLSPECPITFLAFNPEDNNQIAACLAHGEIALWDRKRGPFPIWKSNILQSHERLASCLYWKDKHIISGGADGTIRLWDPFSPEHLKRVLELGHPVRSLAPGLAGTDDGFVFSFSFPHFASWSPSDLPHNNANSQKLQFEDHYAPVSAVARNPSAEQYFASVTDWGIRIFYHDCAEQLISIVPEQKAVDRCVLLTTGCWSTQRNCVFYTGDTSGTISAWDLTKDLKKPVLRTPITKTKGCIITAMCATTQGLLVGDSEGMVTLIQAGDGLRGFETKEREDFQILLEREQKRAQNYECYTLEEKIKRKHEGTLKSHL